MILARSNWHSFFTKHTHLRQLHAGNWPTKATFSLLVKQKKKSNKSEQKRGHCDMMSHPLIIYTTLGKPLRIHVIPTKCVRARHIQKLWHFAAFLPKLQAKQRANQSIRREHSRMLANDRSDCVDVVRPDWTIIYLQYFEHTHNNNCGMFTV